MESDPAAGEKGDTAPEGVSSREGPIELKSIVFTDLAGFAQLQDELGEGPAEEVMRQHKALLSSVLERYPDGQLVNTTGDGYVLAFATASNAVRFALQFQQSMPVLSRRVGRNLKDRVTIHVGEVKVVYRPGNERIQDVKGVHVSVCARLQDICSPGHILLSHAAFDSAWRQLKGRTLEGIGELTSREHGYFKLKGIQDPVKVYEIAEVGRVELVELTSGGKALRVAEPAAPGSEPGAGSRPRSGTPTGWRHWLDDPLPWRQAWAGALIAALAAPLTFLFDAGRQLADRSYDFAYWLRPPVKPTEAVVVYMDDDSKDSLAESDLREWRRSLHARLIDRLAQAGASAIVFDLLFASTNDVPGDPGGTARLVEAARRFPRVFVAGAEMEEHHNGVTIGTRIVGPFEELRRVVRWGVVQHLGVDAMVRKHYRPLTDPTQPDLAELVAGQVAKDPLPPPDRVRWMNYYGRPGTVPFLSYVNALDPKLSSSTSFSNRVVFVGAKYGAGFRGGRGTDDFETPYFRATGQRSPGVEVNATAYLNLIRRDWLTRVSGWLDLVILAVLGGACGVGVALLRPAAAVVCGVGVAAVIALTSILLVWQTHAWYSWTVTALIQVPCAVAWSWFCGTRRVESESKPAVRPQGGV